MSRSLTERQFTDAAQHIVKQIPERASDRGLITVDDTSVVPLVLWTLIRWERKVALGALEMMGVDLDSLAHQLDSLLARLAEDKRVVAKDGVAAYAATGEYVVFDVSTPLEPLLSQAESEASKLQHDYVGSEHLLLAIITRADSELSSVLKHHQMDYDCTKDAILELLARRF